MSETFRYKDYGFTTDEPSHMHRHFLPPLFELCGALLKPGARVLNVGCGNGYTVGQFVERGCEVVGIDLSESGIVLARSNYPKARFECLPADDQILNKLGVPAFDLVVSTEVIEHLYDPYAFVQGCFAALRLGGRFILSTPYHGHLKNLVLALLNKCDTHASPLWRGGHIKLWSRKTLSQLLTETGFTNLRFRGAGRLPFLWMTVLMSGDQPSQ
jgi:2-polyprenyl-3-methyl-5-hydroxy-6-metoxy-1,4-benzoquinol methylase